VLSEQVEEVDPKQRTERKGISIPQLVITISRSKMDKTQITTIKVRTTAHQE